MMMKATSTALLTCFYLMGFAQKPPVDHSICKDFPKISDRRISNDGKYILYTIVDSISRLYVKELNSSYEKEFTVPDAYGARFSGDSRWLLFLKANDSLCIFDLNRKQEQHITGCKSFKTSGNSDDKWVACQLANQELVLKDLSTGQAKRFPDVEEYIFGNHGNTLLLTSKVAGDSSAHHLLWANIRNGNVDTIWQGNGSSSYVFDGTDSRLAFLAEDTTKNGVKNAIWYYENGAGKASLLVGKTTRGLTPGTGIVNFGLRFSPKADKLFFNVSPLTMDTFRASTEDAPVVDIWSYKDAYHPEDQLQKMQYQPTPMLLAVINIDDQRVIILKNEDDAFIPVYNQGGNDNFVLFSAVRKWIGYSNERWRRNMCLVNTKDGSRTCLPAKYYANTANFSAGGRYLAWYDLQQKNYFTLELSTGKIENISEKLNTPVYDELSDTPSPPNPYRSSPVWTNGDEAVLIYDRYDIWKVDPAGRKQPVNITNGYGKKHKIVLRCAYLTDADNNPSPVKIDSAIILSAFNELTKENGFYSLNAGPVNNLQKLLLAPKVYYFPENYSTVSFSTFLIKAKNADVYVLTSESASEYPNLVATKDFKKFNSISSLAPHKAYNWLTSEIVNWTAFDGHEGSGILYKPENFDPKKKYPLIFYFYERLSDGLNKFITPELSTGSINIPYFVSRDYLVFCPDIHYTVGKPGESVYNYVVSAARNLSKKTFIDSTRIGMQGHSFGGYEVNYLLTRTGLFAAACSAAGLSDLVSNTFAETGALCAGPLFTENASYRMGTTLWKDQAVYTSNSPLYHANRVTTPLLIMHNKNDGSVPWSQGVELFTALRRLGKPVWMLQYDNAGHTLIGFDKEQLDYTIRLNQFFDHYLKNRQAPGWMTQYTPANARSMRSKKTPDASGMCSDHCDICRNRGNKVETDQTRSAGN